MLEPPSGSLTAHDLNQDASIVGLISSSANRLGFLYSNGQLRKLSIPTTNVDNAYHRFDINDVGQIVAVT
jgi:hypothetical protein